MGDFKREPVIVAPGTPSTAPDTVTETKEGRRHLSVVTQKATRKATRARPEKKTQDPYPSPHFSRGTARPAFVWEEGRAP